MKPIKLPMLILLALSALLGGCSIFTERADFGIPGYLSASEAHQYALERRILANNDTAFDCDVFANCANTQLNDGAIWGYESPNSAFENHAIVVTKDNWVIDINRQDALQLEGSPYVDLLKRARRLQPNKAFIQTYCPRQ